MDNIRHDGSVRKLTAQFKLCTVNIKTDITYSWAYMIVISGTAQFGFAGSRVQAEQRATALIKQAKARSKPELAKLVAA